MRGATKHFNTIQDIENSIAVDAAGTRPVLQALLDGRFCWEDKGKLAQGVTGVEDATHKIVEMADEADRDKPESEQRKYKHQMELVEDKHAHIFRLGLTVAQVEAFLKRCPA